MNSVIKNMLFKNRTPLNLLFTRKFRTKGVTVGKPPGVAKTIEQILQDSRKIDETIYYKVDIGLPYSNSVSKQERLERQKIIKNNQQSKELEKLARKDKLLIPVDDVYNEWVKSDGPAHIKNIADHYAIFDHLFDNGYFHPVTSLNIAYKVDDEYAPVYYGNSIKPNEAREAPIVNIETKPNTLHTLILTNLDGHLNCDGKEYVHWFVGNIPDGDISKGETIYPYLQPFPTKGTGYHRLVFVLYEHSSKLDYSTVSKPPKKILKPDMRNFCTYDFYKHRQDDITPSGLAFFQSDWDTSVTDVFHNIFIMAEPRFQYKFKPDQVNAQLWFPKKQPFNVYLDRFRDPKDISKEILLKKLKTHQPFEKPEPPLKYPHAHSPYDCKDKPSWLQVAIKKERLGWGKPINDNLDILYPK